MTALERRILAERLLAIAGVSIKESTIRKIEEELERNEL